MPSIMSQYQMLSCFNVVDHQASTDVLVGIKVQLTTVDPSKPDVGRIEFFLDWLVHFYYSIDICYNSLVSAQSTIGNLIMVPCYVI